MRVLVLKDCLYAPDIPINLLSVGSMMENDVRLTFEKEATTLYFPSTSKNPNGESLQATVHDRLLFLYCNFILPNSHTKMSLPVLEHTTTLFLKVHIMPSL